MRMMMKTFNLKRGKKNCLKVIKYVFKLFFLEYFPKDKSMEYEYIKLQPRDVEGEEMVK